MASVVRAAQQLAALWRALVGAHAARHHRPQRVRLLRHGDGRAVGFRAGVEGYHARAVPQLTAHHCVVQTAGEEAQVRERRVPAWELAAHATNRDALWSTHTEQVDATRKRKRLVPDVPDVGTAVTAVVESPQQQQQRLVADALKHLDSGCRRLADLKQAGAGLAPGVEQGFAAALGQLQRAQQTMQ